MVGADPVCAGFGSDLAAYWVAVMVEEWRATHHPDYDVSNLGRVRSRAHNRRLGAYKILRCSRHQGYPTVGFWPDKTRFLVHRLVAAAFIGPCPEGYQVMHKDDDPSNPNASNLVYGTPLQNVQDMHAKGRWTRQKLTREQVRDIRCTLRSLPRTGPAKRIPNGSCKRLAEQYSVTERCIEAVWWGVNYPNV